MNKFFLEMTLTVVILALAIAGLYLVVMGTTDVTAGRFLIPPEILPGVGVIFFDAVLIGFAAVRLTNSTFAFSKLRQIVMKKIGESEGKKLRNMALLLTFCIFGFSMTRGVTPMYRVLGGSFALSLVINIFISILGAIGVFGWVASLCMSKNREEKS
ncbi:MAG: hypothetical protein ACREBU_08960 [Nitrososphaera sp.]